MARRIKNPCDICGEPNEKKKFSCPLEKDVCTECFSDEDKCDYDKESESCWEQCEHVYSK